MHATDRAANMSLKLSRAVRAPFLEASVNMFNPAEILIDAFGEQLRAGYRRMYGGLKSDYEDIICWASSMSLENIAKPLTAEDAEVAA